MDNAGYTDIQLDVNYTACWQVLALRTFTFGFNRFSFLSMDKSEFGKLDKVK